jgi:alpha-L-fucosidase
VNTSIRPEWFYHPSEDNKVKTVPHLMETYYNSIGRNGTLLLNFPIMPNGLIHENDEKAVLEFASTVKASFADNLAEDQKVDATNVRGNSKQFGAENLIDNNKDTYWATDDSVTTPSLTIDFEKPTMFNRFMVQEYIRLGQRVKSFTVEAFIDGAWKELVNGTTIGYKRILRFPGVEATKVRFRITGSKGSPVISNIGIYNAPVFLNAPTIMRNQSGEITITTNDIGPYFYYTLDGSEPSQQSKKYTGPVPTDGKVDVKAVAHDPSTNKISPVAIERFDISRKDWKIIGVEDANAYDVLDGNISTKWHQSSKVMPVDLVIDLGSGQNISGFRYHPDDGVWGPGIITHYEFYVSPDTKKWKLVDEGEFSNIKNNPVWQIKKFPIERARYIKLRALKDALGNDRIGYAEIDVITD